MIREWNVAADIPRFTIKILHFSDIFILVNKFPPCCRNNTHGYDIYERSTKLVGTSLSLMSISVTSPSPVPTTFVFTNQCQDVHIPEKKEILNRFNIIYQTKF